jgi:small subunit ribosomal protein S2
MRKLPDVIFVVDWAFEKQAVKEANTLKIPAYAVLNTNGDPDLVEAFIPANTNSVKSLDFIADALKKELSAIKPAKKSGSVKKIADKKTTAKKTTKKEEK